MTRYLFEVGLTPQSFAALIKNPHDRAEAIRPMYDTLGGKLEAYYFAVGSPTVYVIGQLPDGAGLEALTMTVLAGGAVASIKTVPLLTAAEAVAAMQAAANLRYRPPTA